LKETISNLFAEMTSRHHGIFSRDEIERTVNSTVSIAGLGSVGSSTADLVARTGVSDIRLADLDFVDITNLNRQILYDLSDVGQPKVYSALRKLRQLNPALKFEIYNKLDDANISSFIQETDIVVDAVDDHLTKVLLSRKAREMNIPVLHLNAFGFRITATTFMPKGILYEELFDLPSKNQSLNSLNRDMFKTHTNKVIKILGKQMLSDEVAAKLIQGTLPHPVFTSASMFAGAIGAMEVVKLLVGREKSMIIAPKVFQFDLFALRGEVFEFDPDKQPTCLY